tara:strand:- start:426 stop:644 length:219 start_codon:yes stop_codon:yes gene_type:complete
MSRTYNTRYFEAIEEIESLGEDYNRGYAIRLLVDVGMPMSEATDFCDDLEARGDMLLDNMAEQQREEGKEDV